MTCPECGAHLELMTTIKYPPNHIRDSGKIQEIYACIYCGSAWEKWRTINADERETGLKRYFIG